MAIEIVSCPVKNCDFRYLCQRSPEGKSQVSYGFDAFPMIFPFSYGMSCSSSWGDLPGSTAGEDGMAGTAWLAGHSIHVGAGSTRSLVGRWVQQYPLVMAHIAGV